jgi:hypothetical protein
MDARPLRLSLAGAADVGRFAALAPYRGSVDFMNWSNCVTPDSDMKFQPLIEAADYLSACIEASTNGGKGLKHPNHARYVAPARRKIERVLRHYFHRQESALLAEIKPKIEASNANQSEPIRTFREASSGGTLYAHTILPTSIAPLRFPVTAIETEEFNDAIREAIKGAAAGLSAGTIAVDDAVSRWLRDNSLTRLTGDFSTTSVNRLRDAVADAWDQGGSFDQIVKAIQDTFADFSDRRAGVIAQTEVNDAYNRGRMYTAVQAGFDQKAWDPDGEACAVCMENVDAGFIGIDDEFPSGDLAPTAHPNCFLAGTVISAGGITGSSIREYEGEVVILRITNMNDTAVTPNHPILTRGGWRAAGSLQVGDYIAQCIAPSKAAILLDPNDHYIEARIEQIPDSLFMAGGMSAEGVPVSSEAFHGDIGSNGKVDIVRTAGSFPRSWTDGVENGEYNSLGLRHSKRVAFLEQCAFLEMLEALSLSSDGIMGTGNLRTTGFGGHCGSSHYTGRASAALMESECSPLTENEATRNSGPLGDFQKALSCLVRLVKITSIEVRSFSGHVYNLETKDGIYFANSIITHNCDCSIDFQKGVE